MRLKSLVGVLLAGMLAGGSVHAATFLSPTPYRSAAESPFGTDGFTYFHLENFEDGALNTPGVTPSGGVVLGPGSETDSVDADDGQNDGSGLTGRSWFSNLTENQITFTFNAGVLGRLPTHVGLVWTDVGRTDVVLGVSTVRFEAFGPDGQSLGTVTPTTLGDGAITGGTAEDRFFGVIHPRGISSVRVSVDSSRDWEIDHLQYGAKTMRFDDRRHDFQANNRSDVLWRDVTTGQNAIWTMDGSTLSSSALIADVADTNWSIVGAGDFDGDGRADILWRNAATGDNAMWLMNDTTIKASAVLTAVPDLNWRIAGIGDFDDDARADILWRNQASGDNAIWFMNGTSMSSASLITAVPDANWRIAGVGDFDGNGKADILWRNAADGQNAVWLMNGASMAGAALLSSVTDQNWQVFGVADYDGDTKADILWRDNTNGGNAIWMMDGAVARDAQLLPTVADGGWRIVGTGDYNGDGKSDVLWRHNATGENAMWLMNGFTLTSSALLPTVPVGAWTPVP